MNLSDFGMSGTRRKTLFILGAGATRGASYVEDNRPRKLPPLDKDFFQQMTRTPFSNSVQNEAEKIIAFARDHWDTEVDLSMEEFLSEVEYTDRFHKEFNVDPGPHVKRYQKALDRFHRVLPAMLNKSADEKCDHHNKIAANLHTNDCVISFNYDCTIDRALKHNTLKRWDPEKKVWVLSRVWERLLERPFRWKEGAKYN